MTMVYLGGPIDLQHNDAYDWRKDVARELLKKGISSYDPRGAFKHNVNASVETQKALIEINKQALLNCDVAIFVMYSQVPSVGTPIELHMAQQNGITTITVWDPHRDSHRGQAIATTTENKCKSSYVLGLSDFLEYRFDSAVELIAQVDKGLKHLHHSTPPNIKDINQ
jgi:nucleoside 2-deoxyribosyltransferase